ncbi:MAG: 5-formyltetrahydrofolate cyclo-ligase [Ruminococcaceae bacterium]|nr:5-formyltetrahydrofolate cyclo-ligase [Oscillospiraceae bacterium]
MASVPEAMVDKTHLRRHYEVQRRALSENLRATAASTITSSLFALPEWQTAPMICGYVATRGEIDLSVVWETAIRAGKDYALPVTVTDAKDGQMIFRRLKAYTPHTLIPARFGILEPSDDCPATELGDFQNALILVPGLAFDNAGFRIGYGGGYYDRFLATLRDANISVTTVGLAFSVCRPPILPHESHDVAVEYIVDERRVIRTHGQSKNHR